MLADLALLIQVVGIVIYDIMLYGLLLAIFIAFCTFFVGYAVYAYACWRNRP